MSRSEHTHISILGNNQAFTLIELIVVITLIAIMFFFAIPRLDKSMFFNESRQVSSWIALKVQTLKSKAVSKGTRYFLHVDIADNRLWISKASDNGAGNLSTGSDGMGQASKGMDVAISKQNELNLPKGFHLLDVEFSAEKIVDSGTVDLLFSPKGFSDRAIIHLERPDGKRYSYIIESFLPQVTIRHKYVGF